MKPRKVRRRITQHSGNPFIIFENIFDEDIFDDKSVFYDLFGLERRLSKVPIRNRDDIYNALCNRK